jgi:hypothetical protein
VVDGGQTQPADAADVVVEDGVDAAGVARIGFHQVEHPSKEILLAQAEFFEDFRRGARLLVGVDEALTACGGHTRLPGS